MNGEQKQATKKRAERTTKSTKNSVDSRLEPNKWQEQKLGDEYHTIAECKNDILVDLRPKFVPQSVRHRPSMHTCLVVAQKHQA